MCNLARSPGLLEECQKVGEIGKVSAANASINLQNSNEIVGFSPDPVLTGVAMAQTVMGIQDAGVVACAKHYVGNEQEHYRQAVGGQTKYPYSANIDDTTMHELYLWYETLPKTDDLISALRGRKAVPILERQALGRFEVC